MTDRRTDRQTDGRTDRIAISILRVSVLTRDKNEKSGSDKKSILNNYMTIEIVKLTVNANLNVGEI